MMDADEMAVMMAIAEIASFEDQLRAFGQPPYSRGRAAIIAERLRVSRTHHARLVLELSETDAIR